MKLTIASRASALARWQANHVADQLRAAHADLDIELLWVRTTGDRITDVPLASIGGTGIFTREVDHAVLRGDADVGVHSLKDVPTQLHPELVLGAIPHREDPRDAFVAAPGRPARLLELPAGSRIGTSSLRRRALLLDLRPDLRVEDLRGNLDTRLARVADATLDGAILALAGIRRLGREETVSDRLDPSSWIPACGQGALAVVARREDTTSLERIAALDDSTTRAAVTAERTFLRTLEGGCQVPIGGWADVKGDIIELHGFVSSVDGRRRLRAQRAGIRTRPEDLGVALAEHLRDGGADRILASIRAFPDITPP
jgi:hydroxymethylbilane synthase